MHDRLVRPAHAMIDRVALAQVRGLSTACASTAHHRRSAGPHRSATHRHSRSGRTQMGARVGGPAWRGNAARRPPGSADRCLGLAAVAAGALGVAVCCAVLLSDVTITRAPTTGSAAMPSPTHSSGSSGAVAWQISPSHGHVSGAVVLAADLNNRVELAQVMSAMQLWRVFPPCGESDTRELPLDIMVHSAASLTASAGAASGFRKLRQVWDELPVEAKACVRSFRHVQVTLPKARSDGDARTCAAFRGSFDVLLGHTHMLHLESAVLPLRSGWAAEAHTRMIDNAGCERGVYEGAPGLCSDGGDSDDGTDGGGGSSGADVARAQGFEATVARAAPQSFGSPFVSGNGVFCMADGRLRDLVINKMQATLLLASPDSGRRDALATVSGSVGESPCDVGLQYALGHSLREAANRTGSGPQRPLVNSEVPLVESVCSGGYDPLSLQVLYPSTYLLHMPQYDDAAALVQLEWLIGGGRVSADMEGPLGGGMLCQAGVGGMSWSVPDKSAPGGQEDASLLRNMVFEAVPAAGACQGDMVIKVVRGDLESSSTLCMRTPGCVGIAYSHAMNGTRLCYALSHSRLQPSADLHRSAAVGREESWTVLGVRSCKHMTRKLALMNRAAGVSSGCALSDLGDFTLLRTSAFTAVELQRSQSWSCRRVNGPNEVSSLARSCSESQTCSIFTQNSAGVGMLCSARSSRFVEARRGNSRPLCLSAAALGKGWIVGCKRGESFCSLALQRGASEIASDLLNREVRAGGRRTMDVAKGTLACVETLAEVITPSVSEASTFCSVEPLCTAFVRNAGSKATSFCQGYKKLALSPLDAEFHAGIKMGCESYIARDANPDVQRGSAPGCAASWGGAISCTAARVHVPMTSTRPLMPHTVCADCADNAVCPALRTVGASVDAPGYARTLDDAAKRMMAEGGSAVNFNVGAINPSVVSMGNEWWAVLRTTDALRCAGDTIDGTYELDDRGRGQYVSRIAMCRLKGPDALDQPYACRLLPRLRESMVTNLEDGHSIDNGLFAGEEDARAFAVGDTMYALFNVGIILPESDLDDLQLSRGEKISVRRMVLATVDVNTATYTTAVLIEIPDMHLLDDVKNVMPLVREDGDVALVHSLSPFAVCLLTFRNGACTAERVSDETGSSNTGGAGHGPSHSGSTPLVRVPQGYLGLVHSKAQMELGRLYSHAWVLVSHASPHHTLLWRSPSFRLPDVDASFRVKAGSSTETFRVLGDIQFAAGLVVDVASSTAIVTYGVQDCISWIARVPLPARALGGGGPGSPSSAAESFMHTLKPVHDGATPSRPVVRWDGPVSDMSGFATAARGLLSRMRADESISLQIMDLNRNRREHALVAEYGSLYDTAIRSQLHMASPPDVTIRMHWPPNFSKPGSGKLVMYLPWEFGIIPREWVNAINAHVDEVWVPAKSVKKGFEKSGVTAPIAIVPHGVPEASCHGSAPQRQPSESARFQFLYHGGLLWRKGIDNLLDAFEIVARALGDRVELLVHSIYGDFEVYDLLRRRMSTASVNGLRMRLSEEHLTSEGVQDLYARADVFVHSARSEGFGLGIFEAMSSGLPVVVSNYGPPAEYITNETGFLFDAHSAVCTRRPCSEDARTLFSSDYTEHTPYTWGDYEAEDLAQAMLRAYHSKAQLPSIGARARRYICAALDWADVYATAKRRLDALLDHTRTGR